MFILGLVCALTRSGYSAYRFGGMTVASVLLIPRVEPAWLIALHRFAEVSIGIGVALIFAWVWPERGHTHVISTGPEVHLIYIPQARRLSWQKE